MLAFRALEPSEADRLRPFLPHFQSRLCDFTLGSLFLWRGEFQTEAVIEDGLLYLRMHFQTAGVATAYAHPQGPEPERRAGLDRLLAHSRAAGETSAVLCGVTAEEMEYLRERYDIRSAQAERNWFDYLYDAASFAAMAGRPYAGQRNHINKFLKAFPAWRYEPVGPGNLPQAAAFLERFYQRHGTEGMLREERDKLRDMLGCLDHFNMFGGLLRAGDAVLALALGERVGDTLFVHVEKAELSAPGAYQMIAREFVRRNATSETLYTNREEDAGVEGLRVSKLSYHPVRLLEKHTVRLENAPRRQKK